LCCCSLSFGNLEVKRNVPLLFPPATIAKIDMREKIVKLFESLSRWLYRNPFKALLSVFLLLGILVFQVPSVTIDTSSEALLQKDDPSLIDIGQTKATGG